MTNTTSNHIDFESAHLELCDKETENTIAKNDHSILDKQITYLKEHKNEFLFIDSVSFENLGVDSVSIELDDLFGTYNVMVGLKLQKKFSTILRQVLSNELTGDEPKFSLLFNSDDGLWDLNFPLNNVEGFLDTMTIAEAFVLINSFLSTIVTNSKK